MTIAFCVVPSALAFVASQSASAVSTRRLMSVLVRRAGMMAGGWVGAICSAISRKRAGSRRGEFVEAAASRGAVDGVAKLFRFLGGILRLYVFLSLRIHIGGKPAKATQLGDQGGKLDSCRSGSRSRRCSST